MLRILVVRCKAINVNNVIEIMYGHWNLKNAHVFVDFSLLTNNICKLFSNI